MGTTEEFLKLRSTGTPKTGEWNINYDQALAQAKKENKFIIAVWSNGDLCRYCVDTETCMMTDMFKNWMKDIDAYFVFQCSNDKDEGDTVYKWVYRGTGLEYFPGFRITLYNQSTGKMMVDRPVEGNVLRNKKINEYGAKAMIENLEAILKRKPSKSINESKTKKTDKYKVRLNEKLTVAQVNKILDAIDKNDGYCPCQPKSKKTKCHCEDFKKNKDFDELCICNIYVKKTVDEKKQASKKKNTTKTKNTTNR